jgi:hypothetical protein
VLRVEQDTHARPQGQQAASDAAAGGAAHLHGDGQAGLSTNWPQVAADAVVAGQDGGVDRTEAAGWGQHKLNRIIHIEYANRSTPA